MPSKFKNYHATTEDGRDRVFYAIKNKCEQIINEQGEGRIVAYSVIEGFAFSYFIDHTKDKSTLRAKCRSIWNWYDNRGWTIPRRQRKTKTEEELFMTRSENANRLNEKRKNEAKAKVKGAIESLKFIGEKTSVRKIAEYANISTATARKYYKEFL